MRREPARAIGSTRECQMILKDTRWTDVNQGTGTSASPRKVTRASPFLTLRCFSLRCLKRLKPAPPQFACRPWLWDDRESDTRAAAGCLSANRAGPGRGDTVMVQPRDVTEVLNRDFLETRS